MYVLVIEYMIRTSVWVVRGNWGDVGLGVWFKGRRAADSGFPLGIWRHHAARRLHAALKPFLAVTSVIPVLRNVALLIGKKVSFALDFVVWIGFVLSWALAITQLNLNLWWAELLLWGGLALIIFMLVRMALRVVRS